MQKNLKLIIQDDCPFFVFFVFFSFNRIYFTQTYFVFVLNFLSVNRVSFF